MEMPEGALEMVSYGYTEDTRCLGFLVSFHDFNGRYEGAKEAVRIIDAYNDFSHTEVNAAIDSILGVLTYPGIEIGREGSPVIYLHTGDISNCQAIVDAMTGAKADEVDIIAETNGGRARYRVRAWWD